MNYKVLVSNINKSYWAGEFRTLEEAQKRVKIEKERTNNLIKICNVNVEQNMKLKKGH